MMSHCDHRHANSMVKLVHKWQPYVGFLIKIWDDFEKGMG